MSDINLNRRTLLGGALLATTLGSSLLTRAMAQGQTAVTGAAPAVQPGETLVDAPAEPAGLLSKEVIELWPAGRVPGGEGMTISRQVLERGSATAHDRAVMQVSRPIIEVFRPKQPNGAAMVILPGGAYRRLAVDKEGAQGAHRLMEAGITCFVLNYRLPVDGWPAGYDVALQDAQRAVRLVRAHAKSLGVDTQRVGVMGFSAGGHLAAAMLMRYDADVYKPVDANDKLSARPDVVMLGYSFNVVGSQPVDITVSAETGRALNERARTGLPPTFILHSADDKTVPVTNSLAMYHSLLAANVPVEMHLYQEGGHGFGFSLPDNHPASQWPDAFELWLQRSKFI